MIGESFAEKMPFEQRSEGGERARHTGKSMPNRIASVKSCGHNVPGFKKEQGLCG